jgi:hypothetical protein
MKIIDKIEIKNFRSFGNRKENTTQILNIKDLNIFSGSNDSGKSNILRALNLFFNKQTNLRDFLNFDKDFFKRQCSDNDDIKEEKISIKIFFWNENNKNKNNKKGNESRVFLPEKFWVARKWKKSSEYSSYDQDSGIETEFKREKGKEKYITFLEEGKLKPSIQGSLAHQLTTFINSIQYYYIPAIKDQDYFSHLYGELQQTLVKERNSNVDENTVNFQNAIQESTKDLMEDFLNSVDVENFKPLFELPNLISLFKKLNVNTGNINLPYRGDGIQAKIIPEILNFIAKKELKIKKSTLKQGEKFKKFFIWGFEEPENSYEYKNAQLLADKFKNHFAKYSQIFLTTHSFNFISMEGDNISTYRIWKDKNIESSKISKIIQDSNECFKFEGNDIKDDLDLLNEELGIFTLNKYLEKVFLETENKNEKLKTLINTYSNEISEINMPVIISEGNNFQFIEKAKEFFDNGNKYEIFKEKEFGDSGIVKLFKFLIKTQNKTPKKIFILDCDSSKKFKELDEIKTDYLIPYIFNKNTNNNIIKKGIENLFDESLIENNRSTFYNIKNSKDEYGAEKNNEIFDKNKFMQFILDRNNEEDFKNFKPLFGFIKDQCSTR